MASPPGAAQTRLDDGDCCAADMPLELKSDAGVDQDLHVCSLIPQSRNRWD
jgi:hypothetical protein